MKLKYANHGSAWTLREIRYVEKHYLSDGVTSVARKLGRTEAAVRSRAHSLGCGRKASGLWTYEEMQILRINYARGDGISSIIPLLPGRTRETIFSKATSLGITSPRNWNEEECNALREYYPVEGVKMAERIGRSVDSVKLKAASMGIKFVENEKQKIWTEDERELLMANIEKPLKELHVLFPDRTRRSIGKARERIMRAQKKVAP